MSDDLARTWPSDPARPPRQAAPGHLIGVVSGLQLRYEGGGEDSARRTVLSFRISPGAADPGQLSEAHLREVEVRAYRLSGGVRDGDWVEVADKTGSGLIRVNRLGNLTTGATVSNGPTSTTGRVVAISLGVLFAIFFLVVAGVIVHGMLTMNDFTLP